MPARPPFRLALAPALAVTVAAGALVPAASPAASSAAAATSTPAAGAATTTTTPATTQMATGPGSSKFTQDEVDNATRFLGLLVGIGAVVVTLGAAGIYFAGPHIGLKVPQLPGLPR